MLLIRVKKIPKVVETGITCYKCHKNVASFYLIRKDEKQSIDIPLCNVCLSAYLNYLDDKLIKWAYDETHPEPVANKG